MSAARLGLRAKVLLAALKCSQGDTKKTFTIEELLVEAWKQDPEAWGLRGYERQYPDIEKMNKEINSRGPSSGSRGLVNDGYFTRDGTRVYRLTSRGLAAAASLNPTDETIQIKLTRELDSKIKVVLDSPVFRSWLSNPEYPKYFRDAGYFWGIAPGSPPQTVRERVGAIDSILKAAHEFMEARGINEVADARNRVLFDRKDLERCLEFQQTLKERFSKDLAILNPEGFGNDLRDKLALPTKRRLPMT